MSTCVIGLPTPQTIGVSLLRRPQKPLLVIFGSWLAGIEKHLPNWLTAFKTPPAARSLSLVCVLTFSISHTRFCGAPPNRASG